MAEDVMWKEKYTKLKERYAKLEEGRNALRQGLSIFEQQISKIQADNLALKKAYEDEKARADNVKAEQEKESAVRVSLENELCALKSEIQTLQENGKLNSQNVDGEVLHLEKCLSEGEKEINQVKELLEKERMRADAEKKRADSEKRRADSEKKKAETERKNVDEALKKVKAEKNQVQEDKRLADVERKKAEEYRVQLEASKTEISQVNKKLALEKSKYDEIKKQLEDERGHLAKEKKRADLVVAKADQQRKLAEANRKMAIDEKNHVDMLSKQLEEERRKTMKLEKEISELVSFKKLVEVFGDLPDTQRISGNVGGIVELCSKMTKRNVATPDHGADPLKSEELHGKLAKAQQKIISERMHAPDDIKKAKEQKKVSRSYKKAEEDKHHVDKLYETVEDNKRRIEEMQSLVEKLVSSKTCVESPLPVSDKSSNTESAELKLLRKKLKFEKMLVKHAKQVAELEVARNQILRQELCCLKQEFVQLSQHLDVLDKSVFSSGEDIRDLEKLGVLNLKRKYSHMEPRRTHLLTKKEVLKPTSTGSTGADGSLPFKLSMKGSGQLLPLSGGGHTESISGIDSKLEPSHRGSNQKMLQSSAINSSSASFSDRPLVGSQEGGAFSVTTSAKFAEDNSNLEHYVSKLFDGTRERCCSELAAIADNSIKSDTHVVNQEKTGTDNRNKESLVAVESIENLYSKSQKWHQPVLEKISMLNGVLNTDIDQSLPEEEYLTHDLCGNLCSEDVRCYKRRKISCQEDTLDNTCDFGEPKSRLETSSIEESDICGQSSPSSYNPSESFQASKDQIEKYFCDQHVPGSFRDLAEEDYMKLLDLDNDVEEKSYRAAMERPLSPTLPQIEFNKSETFELDDSDHPVIDNFHKGISNIKHNMGTYGDFDVMEVEIDSINKMKLNGLGTSKILQPHQQKGVNNSNKNLVDNENGKSDIAQVGVPRFCQIHDSGAKSKRPDVATSGKLPSTPCESVFASSYGCLPSYCIVPSNVKDHSSISRIFGAIRNFKSQYSAISSSNFVCDILAALMKAEDLSSQEKACTFVSLFLQNICEAAMKNLRNDLEVVSLQFVDFLHYTANTVFAHVDAKNVLVKLWDLHDLLNIVEDFLLSRRVLVDDDVSSESVDSFILNGNDAIVSLQAAPTCLLVAGAVLLASICASIDHVGFICEASCNIFRIGKQDFSLVLIILHVFAHVCGAKYFAQEGYGLAMAVVRSLVVYLERVKVLNDSASCFASLAEAPCKLWLCSNCPFLENASSINSLVPRLLEELQNCIITGVERQNHAKQLYLSNSGLKSNEEDSWKVVPSDEFGDEDLSNLFDILSLMELVARFMSWNWSFDNIVCPMLTMLESCAVEHFCSAVIILLGQLGRFGIDDDGYANTKIDDLRGRLSALISQSATTKFGILVQFSSATALIGLTPLSFDELVNSDANVPATADCIKKWFFSLSIEQQSAFRNELSSTTPRSRIGVLRPQLSC